MSDKFKRRNSLRSEKSPDPPPRRKRHSVTPDSSSYRNHGNPALPFTIRNHGSSSFPSSSSSRNPSLLGNLPVPSRNIPNIIVPGKRDTLFPSRSNGDFRRPSRHRVSRQEDERAGCSDDVTRSRRVSRASNMDHLTLLETSDAEIQELFQLMDVNKDQKLAPKELDCILRALGINATEADLIEFIGELPALSEAADKDCVTYDQFAESIKKNMALTSETDSLQVTFNAFDHAGDGFIDGEKLKSVLSNLGLQFQDSDIQGIIQHVGSSGRITFHQFQQFMLNNDDII